MGGDDTFNFTYGGNSCNSNAGSTGINTTGGTGQQTTVVKVGNISVKETLPTSSGPSWLLDYASCSPPPTLGTSFNRQSQSASGLVSASGATCTFNNVKQGTLIIEKNTSGGDSGAWFNYNITQQSTNLNYTTTTNENLAVQADQDNPTPPDYTGQGTIYLDPGTYDVAEQFTPDWTFKDASCTYTTPSSVTPTCPPNCPSPSSTPSNPTGNPTATGVDNIAIVPGGTTTCVFNNTGQGTLKIVQKTIGGDGTENFRYDITRYDTASPTVTSNSLDVKPNNEIKADQLRGDEYIGSAVKNEDKGTTSYTVTWNTNYTTGSQDWFLNSIDCQLQNGVAVGSPTIYNFGEQNITIESGKTTTCTITHTKAGELLINKTVEQPQVPPTTEQFNFDINFSSSRYPAYFQTNTLKFPPPVKTTTVDADSEETVSIYPGTYNVIEHQPAAPPFALKSFDCILETNQPTGKSTATGSNGINVYAGKTTDCSVDNVLTENPAASGGRGGNQQQEEQKPSQY